MTATPGPWYAGKVGTIYPIQSNNARIGLLDFNDDQKANGLHIATFDPPTVLALIAKAREAEWLRAEWDEAERRADHHAESDLGQMELTEAAMKEVATLTADLATARAQLATAKQALERLSALTPGAANSATPRDLHLTVKAIADTALAQLPEAPK